MISDGIPLHVGIIMDGNARWARSRGLQNFDGYRKGVDAAVSVVKAACELGISYLTLFLFSTENWSRSSEDVNLVFNLFQETCTSRLEEVCRAGAKIKVIGDREALNQNVRQVIALLEAETAQNEGIQVYLAMNYGGRAEILRAVSMMVSEGVPVAEIDAKKFSAYLYTKDLPDPDLIIRTAGEKRLSNFLLWQSSYSEFYFCDTLWPDFEKEDFILALDDYRRRDRKYGK
ncbi:di-trans,poly-cis-decaprenylcistransferase [Neorickettsia helminthoeca str. Oregon]|uniref:Isoprenyl transferase n=1 Tax=Neorickettsia helminthoeca str. Oregon TaxID=1286528 RepID=X5HMU5_9RICK|nr:polyprenyl diphosphate synthase [Neorickettsia helminthoeca]AHX11820.1 di-trans,poly-cis-decaprenylcistransferase [Neorickettsia helminthoeca str. Oregon]